MTLNTQLMQAVEQLNYRVTVGDVSAYAGLDVNLTQRGLLTLASEVNGNLQVSKKGEIAYLFPQNFRTILRNKSLKLHLQEWGAKLWQTLFYLIRISFGVFLIISIILIFITVILILMATSNSRGGHSNNRRHGSSIPLFLPHFGFGSDLFWFFSMNHYGHTQKRSTQPMHHPNHAAEQLNFFEAVFSFLFGDGDPNAHLEERRWRIVGNVITNQGGAIVAEQVAPYLDISKTQVIDEAYMLPTLLRFDGRPEVSARGDIIYRFPVLQTTAAETWPKDSIPSYLHERFWNFSQAKPDQIWLVIGLGFLNLVGALILRSLLSDGTIAVQLGGLVAFVQSIFWILLGYGIGFLGVPLIRYFWIQRRNRQIKQRNQERQAYASVLSQADSNLQQKIQFAQQFANQFTIASKNLAYTTERELLEQEIDHLDEVDNNGQHFLS